jgi:NAD(P)-dependent dehydrogenase (short-subunit alcohol dehydrogenase family)
MREHGLRGRAALVTGASSGIGRAIALALGAAGAGIVLIGRDRRRLDEASARARALGAPDVAAIAVDLTHDDGVHALSERILADIPVLDILVHSAGAYYRGSVATAPVEELDKQYMANLRAPILLTRCLLPHLLANRADIVFINSSQGHGEVTRPNTGAFAATQHGLRAFAEALRLETGEHDIRILTMHLGRTATPRQADIFAMEGRPYAPEKLMQPEDVAETVLAALCLPRRAEITSIHMRPAVKSY